MNIYIHTQICTCIHPAVTADCLLILKQGKYFGEKKKSLEDEIWPSGVNCGIRNQNVNSRPSSFTVRPFLPLSFLGDEKYRGNV